MANQELLTILKQGVGAWNQWRKEHPDIQPDLSGAFLSGADLSGADLRLTHFYGAHFNEAHLSGAHLSGAYLRETDLSGAHLSGAYLNGAHLSGAHLNETLLRSADLSGADLSGAHLRRASLIETNLAGTTLAQCSIYGISVWKVHLEGAKQDSLIITPPGEPTITVDNLKIAQFIYLLLNNAEIREVIDTIAKKAVLILGRFTPERKAVLYCFRNRMLCSFDGLDPPGIAGELEQHRRLLPELLEFVNEPVLQLVERREHGIGKVFAQMPENLLSWVQFRTVGWQVERMHACWPLHLSTAMTARTIQHDEVDGRRGAINSSDLPEIPSGGFMKTALFQPSLPEPCRHLSAHTALQGGGSTCIGLIPLRFAASTAPVGFCPPSPAALPPVLGITPSIRVLRPLCRHAGLPV